MLSGDRQNAFGQLLRDLRTGQETAHQHGGRDEQHHDGGLNAAVKHRASQMAQIKVAIPCRNRESGQNRKPGGFGCRHIATKNTAQDDDGQGERRQRVDECLAQTRQPEGIFRREVVALGEQVGDGHQPRSTQEAGHDAGDKQLLHRRIGGGCVKDHGDRRRDDDGQRCGRRGDGGGKFL